MPYEADVYRILIASPSDVEAERDAVRNAIHLWNSTHSYARGVFLVPRFWEFDGSAEMPAVGKDDPQNILNRQLVNECDILIAFFWGRVGTPTPRFPGGTVEEIERFRSSNRPVQLYFCERSIQRPDPAQLDELNKLKETYQKQGLTFNFKEPQELAERVRHDLTSTISTLQVTSPRDRLKLRQEIDKNEFLREVILKINEYTALSDRYVQNDALKRAMGRFFWENFSAEIIDANIRNVFFESGSTIAYLSGEFRNYLQRADGRKHLHEWKLTTNNIITYLQFVLFASLHIDLRPDGPPEEIYGASFGDIAEIGRYRKPTSAVDQYQQLSLSDRNIVDRTVASLVPQDHASLFLCTSSGLELREDAPFLGLHVGSFHNKLFKQAILGTSVPIVYFLDASKISAVSQRGNFHLNKCYPVCDSRNEWDYARTKQPIAFCIGFESESDSIKVESAFEEIGFPEVYSAKVGDHKVGFFANSVYSNRFGMAVGQPISSEIDTYFRNTRVEASSEMRTAGRKGKSPRRK